MNLGSSNSLSYLPAKYWQDRFKIALKRSQCRTYQQQYEQYDIRLYDISIGFNNKGKLEAYHYGTPLDIDYKGLHKFFKYLNDHKDCYCRVTLYNPYLKNDYEQYQRVIQFFNIYCSNLEVIFPNIKFMGGYITDTRQFCHKFKHVKVGILNTNIIRDVYLKESSKWLYNLCKIHRLIYAVLRNNFNRLEYQCTDNDMILLQDYVQF